MFIEFFFLIYYYTQKLSSIIVAFNNRKCVSTTTRNNTATWKNTNKRVKSRIFFWVMSASIPRGSLKAICGSEKIVDQLSSVSIFEGNGCLVFASVSRGWRVAEGTAAAAAAAACVRCERNRDRGGREDTGFPGAADEVLMIGSRQHQLSQLHA